MVNQSFSSKSKYSFRARRGPGSDGLSHEEIKRPAAAATVASGLRPGMLTLPAEKKRYSGNRSEYLDTREFVLLQWDEDRSRFLSEEACLKAAPEGRQRSVREVYRFLHQQGCINFGILKDDPLVPLPEGFLQEPSSEDAGTAAVGMEGIEAEAPPPPKPEATDEAITDHLYAMLPTVDLETTSEKMIRAQLAEHFGVEMSSRKALIRELVTGYLDAGGPPAAYKDRKAKEAAKEAAKAQRTPAPRKPIGKVIVIGAGPAGLTAALHLKRNNVEVVVLEARDRVGGRVNSHTAPGITSPVDLGASIITGTEADVRNGHRADPSAVLARQLGVVLHELQSDVLPLYDPTKGDLVDAVLDKEVERVRDEVMDDAAAILEDMPEADQVHASFGGLLEQAIKQWEHREKKNAESDNEDPVVAAVPVPVAAVPVAVVPDAAVPDAAVSVAAAVPSPPLETETETAVPVDASIAASVDVTIDGGAINDAVASATAAAVSAVATAVEDEGSAIPALPPPSLSEDNPQKIENIENSLGEVENGNEEVKVEVKPEIDANLEPAQPAAPVPSAEVPTTTTVAVTSATPAAPAAPTKEEEDTTTANPPPPPTAAATTIAAATTTEPSSDPLPAVLTEDHLRVLSWHWANLEYGCSAPLSALSAEHWNQDEDFGGFGGPHCMVVGGYDQIFRRLASLLDVRVSTPVAAIKTRAGVDSVEVVTANGESLWVDAVVVTVPLGVLKAGTLAFEPPLPPWKQEAVARLGFGDLNKVVLQFPSVFWDDSVDFFGAVPGSATTAATDRGWCFMFWNFHRFCGAPVLAALVSGEAAREAESMDDDALQERAMSALRALYPSVEIPEPVGVAVSKWASEEYTKGSYSYVAVGASGEDYDQLAKPVARRILFAGEHTVKEHPDTVGGAMMSGIREAVRALEILVGDAREGAAMAADVTAAVEKLKRRHSDGPEASGSKKSKNSGDRDNNNKVERRKRKNENDDYDDDDLERRMERSMGRDMARMHEEMRQKEASRAATKEFWRGLLDAEVGNSATLLQVWKDAGEDAQARLTGARCLTQASVKALQTVGADAECIKVLTQWITESAVDSMLVELLDQLLKALRTMPLEPSMVESTGLGKAVKRCMTLGDPDIRKLAVTLVKSWGATAITTAQRAVNGGGGGSQRPANNNNKSAAARPPVTVVPVHVSVPVQLDEETRKRLEEEEAKAHALEAMAAQLKAQADAQLAAALGSAEGGEGGAEGGGTGGGPLSMIKSFDEYQKEHGVGIKKKPKAKMERISERDGASNGAGGSSGGGGSGSGGSGSGSSKVVKTTSPAEARKLLDGLICALLKPSFNSGKVTKEEYKDILKKAGDKVMARSTADELAYGSKFVESRKEGVTKLVLGYVENYSRKR